jgi:hypothetical protein
MSDWQRRPPYDAPVSGTKLYPKVILAGTRLTRKTDLAFALNEHPRLVGPRRYRYHSPLVFFRGEQDRLRQLAAASRLPVLELDTTDERLRQACARVADWLEERDLLHCRPAA